MTGCGRCDRSLIPSARWNDISAHESAYRGSPVCFHCFMAIHDWRIDDDKRDDFWKRVTGEEPKKKRGSK